MVPLKILAGVDNNKGCNRKTSLLFPHTVLTQDCEIQYMTENSTDNSCFDRTGGPHASPKEMSQFDLNNIRKSGANSSSATTRLLMYGMDDLHPQLLIDFSLQPMMGTS